MLVENTSEFKLSDQARALVRRAQERGLSLHMGRPINQQLILPRRGVLTQ